ncbi:hypothetical protein L8S00_17205 [Vibrio splendidus]|nr:hypothetical protein [Vibrio splendidus]
MRLNLTFSVVIKFLSLFVSFASMRFYIVYFDDNDILGLWFTILAVLNWIMYFDLGVGNGLKNEIISLIANKQVSKAKELFIKSFVFLIFISVFVVVISSGVLYFFYRYSNVEIYGLTSKEFYSSIVIFMVCIVLQFPLKIGISGLLSLQKSALSNLPLLISPSLVLVYLVFFPNSLHFGVFFNLSLVYAFSFIVPLFIAVVYVVRCLDKYNSDECDSTVCFVEFKQKILKPGMGFFSIQFLLLLVVGSNEFFILNFLDSGAIVEYQAYYRLYSIPLVFFSTLSIPIWGYLRDAFIRESSLEIKKFTKYLYASLAVSIITLLFFTLVQRYVFDIWLGEGVLDITSNAGLYTSIFIFSIIMINLTAVFTNSIGILKYQVRGLALAFLLKVVLCFTFNISTWSEILTITAISLLPCFIMQICCITKTFNLEKKHV